MVTISNRKSTWRFTINELYTGFQAPAPCSVNPDLCISSEEPMQIFDYSVERRITREKATNAVVEAQIYTPGNPTSPGHPGFGKVGVKTQWIDPEHIKYFINYQGEVNRDLQTLDQITRSLKKLN